MEDQDLTAANDWRMYVDAGSGQSYYHSKELKITTWTKPPHFDSLASASSPSSENDGLTYRVLQKQNPWVYLEDIASGDRYYFHRVTKATCWDPPTEWRFDLEVAVSPNAEPVAASGNASALSVDVSTSSSLDYWGVEAADAAPAVNEVESGDCWGQMVDIAEEEPVTRRPRLGTLPPIQELADESPSIRGDDSCVSLDKLADPVPVFSAPARLSVTSWPVAYKPSAFLDADFVRRTSSISTDLSPEPADGDDDVPVGEDGVALYCSEDEDEDVIPPMAGYLNQRIPAKSLWGKVRRRLDASASVSVSARDIRLLAPVSVSVRLLHQFSRLAPACACSCVALSRA